MGHFLIYNTENESQLDAIIDAIHSDLLEAVLDSYPATTTAYTSKRYHPTENKVASAFVLGKVSEWDSYILNHIDQNDLVELTPDWEPEIS